MYTTKFEARAPASRRVRFDEITVGAAFVHKGMLKIRTSYYGARGLTAPAMLENLKVGDEVYPVSAVNITYTLA